MWWINLVRKVQRKLSSWRLLKICKELGLMAELGGKKMRRTIRGAQAGLRRFARHQKWLISHWAVELRSPRRRRQWRRDQGEKDGGGGGGGCLLVPADLSSTNTTISSSNINILSSKNSSSSSPPSSLRRKRETDGLLLAEHHHQNCADFDDLDVISLDTSTKFYNYQTEFNNKHCTGSHHHHPKSPQNSPSSSSSCESCSQFSSSPPPPPPSSDSQAYFNQHQDSNGNNNGVGPRLVTTKGEKSYRRRHHRRPRSHPSKRYQQQQNEFTEQQNSQRSAFLDFLFEDSPSSSKFLTSQALQNILTCPSCRDILPSNISTSLGYGPCEQCLSSERGGRCLLCECSYGETKSLLLEKLTMRCWIRPCDNRRYGCQSLVGKDLEHTEEECTFKPRFHCPFMLCRRKFPKGSLIKHLHSQHHLYPHDGPKCEGTIFCLPNNKRLRGARANYTLDPCAVSCYGHIFILRILRNSLSWYIWVWTLRRGGEQHQPQDMESSGQDGRGVEKEQIMENFPYTIRFRQPASRSQAAATGSSSSSSSSSSPSPPLHLTLRGLTVSLRLSMEQIMERGLCNILPEQGSLFDCSEENVVDFCLEIHPTTTKSSTARLKFEPKAVGAVPPPPAPVPVGNRRKSH